MKQSLLFILIIFISCQKETINPIKKDTLGNPIDIPKERVLEVIPESRELILTQTEEWENQVLGYFNVVKRPDHPEQMWYTSWKSSINNDLSSYLCYAEKEKDKWLKVKVKNGTNIILGDGKYSGIVEHYVFYDDELEKYRMIGVSLSSLGQSYTYLYSSDDGKEWGDKKLVFPYYYDAQFSVIPKDGVYYVYQRIVLNGALRVVGKSIIDKEGNVIKAPEIIFSDNNDKSFNHIYNNAASYLNDNFVVMFPTYYNHFSDKMYISFAFEQDEKVYTTKYNLNEELFGNESIGWGVVSPGLYPTGEKDTFWVYYYGSSLPHNKRVREQGGYTKFFRIKVKFNLAKEDLSLSQKNPSIK